jgi:predicted N-acetyltransferase YhbS
VHDIGIRRLRPTDSLDTLTDMLHRAFATLGSRGLNCTCTDQSVHTTRQRVNEGDCFVAIMDRHIVGTVTLHSPDQGSPVALYRQKTVASVHQLAVDPNCQNAGIGQALLKMAEAWAVNRGYQFLALDTPLAAGHLLAYYRRRGFDLLDCVQFENKNYRSAILGKSIAQNCPSRTSPTLLSSILAARASGTPSLPYQFR